MDVPPKQTALVDDPKLLAAIGDLTLRGAPMLIVVTFDPRRRAPALEGDVLGMMSLGCVM